MVLPNVNYLAVLVSGVLIFMLGGLWYSPALFAKKWTALMGRSEAENQASGVPILFLQAFLCGLLSAYAIAVLLNHFINLTPLRGAMIGAFCWLGFAGASSYANAIFAKKPTALWLIDTGFNLVSFVLAGVILSVWR
jgi:hypothetical protein